MSSSYLEIYIKLPLFARVPINWHALILNTFGIAMLYYFTCGLRQKKKNVNQNLIIIKNQENIVPEPIPLNHLAMS